MNSKEIRELLPQFVRGKLDPEKEKVLLQAIETDRDLAQECRDLEEYFLSMKALSGLKAPPGFANAVARRIDARQQRKTILSTLFKPFSLKFTIETVGVFATVMVIVFLIHPFKQEQRVVPDESTSYVAEKVPATAKAPEIASGKQEAPELKSKVLPNAMRKMAASKEYAINIPSAANTVAQAMSEAMPSKKIQTPFASRPAETYAKEPDAMDQTARLSGAPATPSPQKAQLAAPAPSAPMADEELSRAAREEPSRSLQKTKAKEVNKLDIASSQESIEMKNKKQAVEGYAAAAGGISSVENVNLLLEIDRNLAAKCESVVLSYGGKLFAENIETSSGEKQYSVRIPSGRYGKFTDELKKCGQLSIVGNQNVDLSSETVVITLKVITH